MIQQGICRDAATALIRAVLMLAPGLAELEEHRGTCWASATFTGMRHLLRLRFSGAAAVQAGEHLAAALADHEFRIAGHIVADIALAERRLRSEGTPALTLIIEALTVENPGG